MRTPTRFFPWLLWWAAIAAPIFAQGPEVGRMVELRFKRGDDPRWAAPTWDDRDWATLGPDEFPAREGVYWVRFRMWPGCVPARPPAPGFPPGYAWPLDQEIDGVYFPTVFAFELYWDGQLLERGGVVGDSRATEIPGPLDHLVRIPDALRGPGEHVVALRISSWHYNFPATTFNFNFRMVSLQRRLIEETRRPIFPLVGLAGALLMAAVCNVLLRFAEWRRMLRLCNLLCFALSVFYGLIAFRWLYNAPYDWHAPRLAAIAVTMGGIGVVLPWLLLEQFGVLRRGGWLAALAAMLVAAWFSSPFYEVKALWMCRAMLLVSLGVAGWAVWRRRPGARAVLAGFAAALLAVQSSPRSFLDPTFFFVFEGLVLFVLAAVGAQVRADRQRAREAALTTVRLETELLKKNIQPHFLLNTLATIVEVIEQEPKTAVELVEALAAEFRILSRVAGEKLIPLGQELDLCRAHLQVMSRRKGVRCSLEASGVDDEALVPPALFHTLIENGLTHLLPRNGEQRFELVAVRGPGSTRYTLIARGEAVERTEAPGGRREGTGLRYVKARLEESFTGRWTLDGGPIEGGWRTVIEIKADGAGASRAAATKGVAVA